MPNKNWIFILLFYIWILSIPLKNALYEISTPLLFIYFVIDISFGKNSHNLKEALHLSRMVLIPIGAIVVSMVFSTLINYENVGVDAWKNIAEFVLRYPIIYFVLVYFIIRNDVSINWIAGGVFLSLFVQLTAGIVEQLGNLGIVPEYIRSSYSPRLIGLSREPNLFGFFMGIGALTGLSYIGHLYSRDKQSTVTKYASIALCVLFLIFMFLSYSRSSWVAFILGVSVLVINNSGKHVLRLKALLIMTGVIAMLMVSIYESDYTHNRIVSIFSMQANSDRFDIWIPALKLIAQSPLVGHGMGELTVMQYKDVLNGFWSFHNATIEILFHTGIFGLLAWLWLVVTLVRSLHRSKAYYLLAVFMMFVVTTQFVHSVFYAKPVMSAFVVFLVFSTMATWKREKRLRTPVWGHL